MSKEGQAGEERHRPNWVGPETSGGQGRWMAWAAEEVADCMQAGATGWAGRNHGRSNPILEIVKPPAETRSELRQRSPTRAGQQQFILAHLRCTLIEHPVRPNGFQILLNCFGVDSGSDVLHLPRWCRALIEQVGY